MKIKVKLLTNVWDVEQKAFDKNAETMFVQGQVRSVFETSKINECLGKKTIEKVLDSVPEILDPGALQAQAEAQQPEPEPEPEPEPPQPPKTKK